MAFDYTDARDNDLIPAKTVAIVQMQVIFHDDGTDGVLQRSKAGDSESLHMKITVLEGPFARRSFFGNWIRIGTTEKQKSMIDHYTFMLRQIINSAKYLDPKDDSEATRKVRTLELRDFDGMRFLAVIGVEPSKDSAYKDKNVISRAITRDMPAWGNRPPIEQVVVAFPGGASASTAPATSDQPAPIVKPKWASD
jgi:hypothetical protein